MPSHFLKLVLSLSLLILFVSCNQSSDFSAKNPQYAFYDNEGPAQVNSDVLDSGENVSGNEDAGDT